MKKNIIVKGDIGTGKTRNVIFPKVMEAIKNGESLVTYSTTEEYLKNFYNEVKKENYNVIIINFNDLKRSMGWNPLSYSYQLFKDYKEDDAIIYLENFYKSLFCIDKSKYSDTFWTDSAKSLAIAATLALFIKGKEDNINISGVLDFINDENLKKKLKECDNRTLQIYAQSFISAPVETTGGIVSVCLQTLRVYASRENLRKMMSHTTYNYEDIKNKPTAIFIISDEDKRMNVPLIISFIREIYSLAKDSSREFNFFLDEIEVLLPFLDDDFTYLIRGSLKNSCRFVLSVQDERMLVDSLGHYILTITEMIDAKMAPLSDLKFDDKKIVIQEKLLG